MNPSHDTNSVHVIFGTGPLATAVMRALQKREKPIRMINRSGRRSADIPQTVEIMAGDAYDPAFNRTATAGAAVVYQCAAPAYQDWPQKFPALQEAVLTAAAVNGAKLIVAENLYMYGDTDGQPMTEEMPYAAHTGKGRVRAAMSESLFAAHQAGQVQAAAARGSDFYGPGVLASAVGERVFAPAVQGKKAQFTGRLDLSHTVTFIDDFGQAMVTLGEREEALGQAWHVPNDRPTITQQELGQLIFAEVGQPPKIGSTGRLMMRLGGLFVPAAKEMIEMMYEFEKPFIVDSSKFEQTFQIKATPIQEGIAQTVAWYKEKK